MKKNIKIIILGSLISLLLGFTLVSGYEKTSYVSAEPNDLFLLQYGVYSNDLSMLMNTTSLENYIYEIIDGLYYVYVGVTKNEKNVTKLKDYWLNKGYSVYVKRIKVNDNSLNFLDQYDFLLEAANDQEDIRLLQNKVLKNYEVINEV